MFEAQELRRRVQPICRDNPGIVISIAWVVRLLEQKLQTAFANTGTGWLTPIPNVVITPAMPNLPRVTLSGLDVTLADVVLDLQLHEQGTFDPTQLISVIRVSFDELAGVLRAKDDVIYVEYDRSTNATTSVDRSQTNRAAVLARVGQTEQDMAIAEEGIRLLNVDTIARSFVDSIRVPDVISAVVAFKFAGTPRLEVLPYDGEMFLVVTGIDGSRIVRPACPNQNAEKEVSFKLGAATPSGRKLSPSINPAQLPVWSAAAIAAMNRIKAEFYLYLPKVQVDLLLDQRPYPAVYLSDQGSIGPVNWDYSVTVAIVRLRVELVPDQVRVIVRGDLVADGRASARIRIGCVESHIGSVQARVRIEFDIAVFPRYEPNSRVLLLDAVIRSLTVRGNEVELDSPLLPWPLEEIVEDLLQDLSGSHLGALSGRVVNLGRFDLARLGRLGVGIQPLNYFTYAGDPSGILLGVTYADAEFPRPESTTVPVGGD